MPKITAAPPIRKSILKKPITPRSQIGNDFLRLGKPVTLDRKTIANLSWLSRDQYAGVLRLVERLNSPDRKFSRLLIDAPQKINRITILPDEYFRKEGEGGTVFDFLSIDFLKAQIDKKTMALDLRNIQNRINGWISQQRSKTGSGTERLGPAQGVFYFPDPSDSRAIETIRNKELQRPGSGEPLPEVLIPKASKLLTEDLLFNSEAGRAYPRTAAEYHALMAEILDDKGCFPGDSEALSAKGTFSPKMRGVDHLSLNRKGKKFKVEILSPHLHAPGLKNRLIFDADLISQAASSDAYGVKGVSYDRESYYVRRLFNAEKVPFIRSDGWPVSFAAMQGYEMSHAEKDLYYAFIHFVMTYGFQGYGLTSYSVREGLSSLFYSDVYRNKPNLMFNPKGELKDYRFRMWAAAHSGKFTPFYSFVKGLGGVDPSWDPIAQEIFRDVHRRITPNEELASRGDPVPKGVVQVNGGKFPIALDRGVYPDYARYPEKNGKIDFPQSELGLSSSIRQVWIDEIEGEQGVRAGNGLYFGGLVTLGKIREAKKKEKQREGGVLERAGDRARSWIVRHTK